MQTIQLHWVRQIRYLTSTILYFRHPLLQNRCIQYSLDMRSQETTQGLIRWTISQDRYDCCCILLSVPRPHSNNSKYWMIRPDHHLQLHLLKDWSHEMSPPTPFHILLHFYLLLLFRFVDMGTSLPPHSPRWLQSYSFGSLVYWCNMFTHIHLLTTIPNDTSSSVTPVTAMRYRSIGFSPPFCCWIIQTLRWMYCCIQWWSREVCLLANLQKESSICKKNRRDCGG